MNDRYSRYCLAAALCVGTIVKLALAKLTFGTNDVVSWAGFLNTIQQYGTGVYRLPGVYGEPFNQPPFMANVLWVMGYITNTFHLYFPLVLKTPAILADIGSVLLVYQLMLRGIVRYSLLGIVAMSLSPISILVSGFHGNTDPVMVFFVLLTLYLLEVKHLWWGAGLAFAMAINIKVVPLIFIPAVFLYLRTWRALLAFFVPAILLIAVCWMPYLIQEPISVFRNTLGYKGVGAPWGFQNVITVLGLSENRAPSSLLRFAIVLFGILAPFWMRKRGVNLFTQFGVILFVFFFLTTALGVQYFAWAVPLVLALGLRWTFAYYLCTGTLLILLYNYWSGGNWYYADSHLQPAWNQASSIAAFVCWAIVGLILIRYKQEILTSATSTQAHSYAPN